MARPVVLSVTGVGNSTIFGPDIHLTPFNIGLFVHVTGTITYTVQATGDNITDSAVTPTWYNHTTLAALSADAASNYAFPVTGIRLNTSVGTGTATLTAIQAGVHN